MGHSRRNLTGVALLLLFLSGCDLLIFSPEEKINSAIPLSKEALLLKKEIFDQLTSNQQKGFENEFSNRLKLRALTCAKGYVPSWKATGKEIQEKLLDRTCFAAADREISRWLGLRQVAIILAKPPLKPIPATPPKFIVSNGFIQTARFASNAGVALLELQQSIQIVDIETGKPIFQEPKSISQVGFLSPNGRLFTGMAEGRTNIRSTETGAVIVELPPTRVHEFHWLDDRAAVYNRSDISQALLVDFASGKDIALPGIQGPVTRVAPVLGNDSQFVAGSYRAVSKFEVDRRNQEPEIKLIDDKPNIGGVWASNTSGQTGDGKRYFNAAKELTVVSLESLEQEKISFEPFYVQTAIATPEPNTVLITGFMQGAPGTGGRHFLYSIDAHTLKSIDQRKLPSDRFIYIPSLKKLAVIVDSKIALLDELPTDEPIALNKFVADAIEEGNVRKFEAFERQQTLQQAPTSSPLGTLRPGTPESATRTPVGPLAELAKGAQIEAIGVYQGASVGMRAGDTRKTGIIEVRVRRSMQPIILVLSSYEAVRWMVTLDPGTRLVAVFVSGYNQSQVVGAGSVRTHILGSTYAYQPGTTQYRALDNDVYNLTGKRISLFQGRYEGATFSVGGN